MKVSRSEKNPTIVKEKGGSFSSLFRLVCSFLPQSAISARWKWTDGYGYGYDSGRCVCFSSWISSAPSVPCSCPIRSGSAALGRLGGSLGFGNWDRVFLYCFVSLLITLICWFWTRSLDRRSMWRIFLVGLSGVHGWNLKVRVYYSWGWINMVTGGKMIWD